MERCCQQSFVAKGLSEGFKLANFGDRHRCATCGQVWVLQRAQDCTDERGGVVGPNEFKLHDGRTMVHYIWEPVTH